MLPPAWLPYRVRSVWNHRRVVHAVRRLHQTPAVAAVSPRDARAEVHMLLCRRDVEIGILALKSLLRFRETPWAVAITDSGTLTKRDRALIDRHVLGCRWLDRVASRSQTESVFERRPRLAALYRGPYEPLRKLIHPVALAGCPRVLVLDPDTLFSRRPERLAAWAADEAAPNLFLHDHQDEAANVPEATRDGFTELERILTRTGGAWSMPSYFFNSGLLAYRRADCDLDIAERYLEWLETADSRFKIGKPGLWFGDWTPEQTAYQLIFARMNPPARPFGEDYRIGNRPGYTFNHFLWLQLVLPSSLVMLQKVVRDLGESHPAAS